MTETQWFWGILTVILLAIIDRLMAIADSLVSIARLLRDIGDVMSKDHTAQHITRLLNRLIRIKRGEPLDGE